MGESKPADILVLGAGVIGLYQAIELQKRGKQVTLLDKNGAGSGCSFGNAGWLTPCFALPLPQPGMLFKSLRWMFDPESPLYVKPELSPSLVRWLLKFLGAMNEKKMRTSIKTLVELSHYSLEAVRTLAQKENSFSFLDKGLLMVSETLAGVRDLKTTLEKMAESGVRAQYFDQAEVLAFEPSLKDTIAGGVYSENEGSVDPYELMQALEKEFLSLGGSFVANAEISDFRISKDKIASVVTSRGDYSADVVVLALGAWSPEFAKKLGVNIPIRGGKGYSFYVDHLVVQPKVPIYLNDRKIAISPIGNRTRVAGTLELVNGDLSISPRRVQAIVKGLNASLRHSGEAVVQDLWRGLRPCTPDGLPMIGFSQKWKNLFYNTGHQMLGLQTGAGSGRLGAELILGLPPFTDPNSLRPGRYE